MQISPSPELALFIKHYLIIENQPQNASMYRFFSDGSPGLVFSYADPLTRHDTHRQSSSQLTNFLYGQSDQYHNLTMGHTLGLLIVVLQPWGLYALSGVPGAKTANLQLDLNDLFGSSVIPLQDQVRACRTNMDRIKQIESFLGKHRRIITPETATIQAAVQLIRRTNGLLPIQQLTERLNITERSLERRFDQIMGISPKQFSRILRLQNGLKLHREQPTLNLTDLAYQAGYYDQAHFIREFNQLAGITPKQYRANTQRLAVNLMPLLI